MYRCLSLLCMVVLIPFVGCLTSCSQPLRKNLVPITESEAGFFPGTFTYLDSLMIGEEARKEIPGGALVIRRDGQIVYSNIFGYTEPGGRERVVPRTYFDVASLTKPLAGIPAAVLIHSPEVSYDQKWTQCLVDLMSHTSNVYDAEKYPVLSQVAEQIYDGKIALHDKTFKNKLVEMVRVRDWEDPCYQYSNSGYIVLGLLATNQVPILDKALTDEFWQAGQWGQNHWTAL
jgi:CubicO group peptidase (beta-lactamase class C family)